MVRSHISTAFNKCAENELFRHTSTTKAPAVGRGGLVDVGVVLVELLGHVLGLFGGDPQDLPDLGPGQAILVEGFSGRYGGHEVKLFLEDGQVHEISFSFVKAVGDGTGLPIGEVVKVPVRFWVSSVEVTPGVGFFAHGRNVSRRAQHVSRRQEMSHTGIPHECKLFLYFATYRPLFIPDHVYRWDTPDHLQLSK